MPLTRMGQILALSCLLGLAACGQQEVYGDLPESQANEAVAALRQADVDATKKMAGEGRWSIAVAPEDFAHAVEVLDARGLPGDHFASLGEVFEKKGFVSSPVEERARLIYGLSQELSHTVSEIDGVVQARVHLAIPEPDPLSNTMKPSSAAVFVKYRPGYDLRSETGAIKSLVTNSIEGLAYDRVSVVMVPGRPTPPASTAIGGAAAPWIAAGLGFFGLGGLGAALFLRRSPAQRRAAHGSAPDEPRSLTGTAR
ncbi:type III secretion system inner membrane ring lipoprotein SctJ [Novosphingobium beihaiensis]|uniref:Lipoprotein n=1 Tax=Novosphingobium beihaiensis TaxID=2930389 RepID=A0ABT0BW99_9SPHN|nr:type III secretion inner membrane ring lipoprotein SctJ [Novosphingobium beihaiensis]MCJ2189091.1 type III secretion inner membrane ring lipoprotein SctJ [Novosphingobium beihaiensis]